jgi:abortive infection bacteriophage resistance protein
VSHFGLAIYIKKYLKAKEELSKLKYFTMQKFIIFRKSSNKRNQNPSTYYNSIITNLKFQHKPKYHLSKILI